MQLLFVVVDTLGAGRVVGVFDSKERAEEVVAIEPAYYRLFDCTLNRVNRTAMEWARTAEQKRALALLIAAQEP